MSRTPIFLETKRGHTGYLQIERSYALMGGTYLADLDTSAGSARTSKPVIQQEPKQAETANNVF